MDFDSIKRKVNLALNLLEENDAFLLGNSVHERSVSYKLGAYMQDLFPGWNVDCEYNRVGNIAYKDGHDYSKAVDLDPLDEKKEDRVFPDIIVHKRGVSEDNLLVLEMKKVGVFVGLDIKKIRALKQKLGYQFGGIVTITKSEAKIDWIEDKPCN